MLLYLAEMSASELYFLSRSKFHAYGTPCTGKAPKHEQQKGLLLCYQGWRDTSFCRMRTTHVGELQELDTSTGQPSPMRTDLPPMRA